MKKIILISCVSKKLDYAAMAERLYISTLFKLNLAYAKSLQPDAIYILSAKYGLLALEEVIEPYDVTLNTMKTAEAKAWAQNVVAQLREKTDLAKDHFIFLAGDKYRRYIAPHMTSYEVPLQGLTIGRQLRQLKQWLDEGTQSP